MAGHNQERELDLHIKAVQRSPDGSHVPRVHSVLEQR